MFTLLPSLYLIGAHYYRQWTTPDHQEQPKEIIKNQKKIQKDEHHKVKLHKKKSKHRRRKTSISALSHDDIMYLINETGFTEEKIIQWYGDFLHDCPDGKLSERKFIDIYQQYYKKGRVAKFCEHAFRLFNKDGSGYMDFIEFLLAVSFTSSDDRLQKIELFFSMYDIDQNGFIDTNEMKTLVESIYELMGIDTSDPSRIDTKVYDIFSKAECDQLGYLRRDQFAIACENDRYIRKLLLSNTKSSDN